MSDLHKHLAGIVQNYPCQHCGFDCYTVSTSQIHYHRCPKCETNHEVEIISLEIKIRPLAENDLEVNVYEVKL